MADPDNDHFVASMSADEISKRLDRVQTELRKSGQERDALALFCAASLLQRCRRDWAKNIPLPGHEED